MSSRARRSRQSFPVLLAAVAALGWAGCDYSFGGGGLFAPGETRVVWIGVQGLVMGAPDASPLERATIGSPFHGPEGEFRSRATTDQEGRYSLVLRHECSVYTCWLPREELMAHLDGYERGFAPQRETLPFREISPNADTVEVTLNFALPRARAFTLTVEGRVTRTSGGAPVPGVEVELNWADGRAMELPPARAITDDEGRYVATTQSFCRIGGSSCFASVEISASSGGEWRYATLESIDVADDALNLTVDFDDF